MTFNPCPQRLLATIEAQSMELANMKRRLKAETLYARLGRLVQQVAHDIQSPLIALKVANQDLPIQDSGKKQMITLACRRIEEISSQLFHSTAKTPRPSHYKSLIEPLIGEVLFEKTFEYRHRPEINLQYTCFTESGTYVRAQAAPFKCVLSNLINNAYNAICGPGKIEVTTSQSTEWICVVIKDSGVGFCNSKVQRRLLNPHRSQRPKLGPNPCGLGLGLAHARNQVSQWGGLLEIHSRLNEPTRVSFTLPVAKTSLNEKDPDPS